MACPRMLTSIFFSLVWLCCAAHAFWGQPSREEAEPAAKPQQQQHQEPWVEVLSWSPRAFLYHGFLTHEECDKLVELARPHVTRSEVVKHDGSHAVDGIRTSSGTFFRRGLHPLVDDINRRVAEWTHLPVENAEAMQILRYEYGEKYDYHYDLDASPRGKRVMKQRGVQGGFRTATVLMYLSDVEAGGETAFPKGTWLNSTLQRQGEYSQCAEKGMAVRPRKGDAILFWSLKPGGHDLDPASFHAGCPVLEGEKWSATKWIRVEPFGRPGGQQGAGGEGQGQGQGWRQQQQQGDGAGANQGQAQGWQQQGQGQGQGQGWRKQQQGGGGGNGQGWRKQQQQGGGAGGQGQGFRRQGRGRGRGRGRGQQQQQQQQLGGGGNGGGALRRGGGGGGGCVDLDTRCEAWAAAGECERNPFYMLGDAIHQGYCLRACGACGDSAVVRR